MLAEMEATPRRPSGVAAWLAQERIFRLVPFVMVEGMFLLLLALPFALTIYISLLRWRASRPFEQAYFQAWQTTSESSASRSSGGRSAERFISPGRQ